MSPHRPQESAVSDVVITPEDAADPTAGRRIRIVKVTRELLCEVLKLPPGTEVLDLSRDLYYDQDVFALKVAHPDFPPVPPGHAIPAVNPVYRRAEDLPAVFVGWGL
jgi:hypothetical protein